MITIPKPAGMLSRLASRDSTRYSMAGIKVLADGAELRLVATDGRMLGIVRGPVENGLDTLDELVPVKEWDAAFRTCPKGAGVLVGNQQLFTEGKSSIVTSYTPMDGRFPEYLRVLPAQYPLFQCAVNPRYLIRVLEVAAAISETEEGACKVHLFCYTPTTPLGVAAVGKDGLTFDGILMPLI